MNEQPCRDNSPLSSISIAANHHHVQDKVFSIAVLPVLPGTPSPTFSRGVWSFVSLRLPSSASARSRTLLHPLFNPSFFCLTLPFSQNSCGVPALSPFPVEAEWCGAPCLVQSGCSISIYGMIGLLGQNPHDANECFGPILPHPRLFPRVP